MGIPNKEGETRSSASAKDQEEMDSAEAESGGDSDEAVAVGSVVVIYTNNASSCALR